MLSVLVVTEAARLWLVRLVVVRKLRGGDERGEDLGLLEGQEFC